MVTRKRYLYGENNFRFYDRKHYEKVTYQNFDFSRTHRVRLIKFKNITIINTLKKLLMLRKEFFLYFIIEILRKLRIKKKIFFFFINRIIGVSLIFFLFSQFRSN